MDNLFSKIGTLIYVKNNHYGYIVTWSLVSNLCKKWSRNRDTDFCRVEEMVNFFNQGGYIPAIIHLAWIKEEGLVCYDGNHRREVFNRVKDKNVICIVDVISNVMQKDVYMEFENINKSVQVPSIYIEDDYRSDIQLQDSILEFVRLYEQKYKPFLSTSQRPRSPNFNRDLLIDNIYHIYKSFHGEVDIERIFNLLERLNYFYSQELICRQHDSFPSKVIEKCKKHNFWLFIEKNIPFEHVYRLHK